MSDLHMENDTTPLKISSSNSAASFDFMLLLDPDAPQILSESLTLESLSSLASDDAIPPFPKRPGVTMSPILLNSHSPMFTQEGSVLKAENLTVTLTTPTAPRLVKMLTESLCVGRWVENTVTSDAPGHVPWEGVKPIKYERWCPTGSLYSPVDFQRALKSARNSRRSRSRFYQPAKCTSNESVRIGEPVSDHQSPNKTLMFEREITLKTDGQDQRWSLQVPASTMNPEMVDMMVELRDLSSFFKDGLEGLEQSVKSELKLPSLMVSDSYCVLPLSPEPLRHPERNASAPLATRRGKSLPSPLFLEPCPPQNSYPDIPSAFMGSPSAYSPKFEHANNGSEPPLALEDMITRLRSQCAYPEQAYHAYIESPVSPISAAHPLITPSQDNDGDDEWAFATSFLNEFGDQPLGKIDNRHQTVLKLPTQCDTLPTGPDFRIGTNGSNSAIIIKPEDLNVSPMRVPASPIPLTPLPSTPLTSSSCPPSPKCVRGILKSCKNVRFASLPDKSHSINIEPITSHPPSAITPLQRPLRMRTTYSRTSTPVSGNRMALITPRSYSSTPEGDSPVSMSPSSPASHLQSKKPTTSSLCSTTRHSVGLTRNSKLAPVLKRANKSGDIDQEDENKARTSRATTNSRWTMNDIAFRRGSSASQHIPEGTPKNRIPVPLRNILTRFK